MSNPRVELPERAPDFVFNERNIMHMPEGREHFSLQHWNSSEADPGFITLDHAVGLADTYKTAGGGMLHQSLRNADVLGQMGMRAALEAVGLRIEFGASPEYGYDYRIRAQYPSVESFCEAANTLCEKRGRWAMPLRFMEFGADYIPDNVELTALHGSTAPIPTSSTSYEYILNKGVAMLALPLQTINGLKAVAKESLAIKESRKQPDARRIALENARYNIHGILNTQSIIEFLNSQEWGLRVWTSTLNLKRGPEVEMQQEYIRKHIAALGEMGLQN